MIKIPKDSFSQIRGSSLSRDRKFRARKKKLSSAISATSLSSTASVPTTSTTTTTTTAAGKKRARRHPGATTRHRKQPSHHSQQHQPTSRTIKTLSDADFGHERNLGYSSFGAYTNHRNPHGNSPAAVAARKHQTSVAAARSAAQQHSQVGGRFTPHRQRVNSVPNLSQYVAPSQRTTMDQVPGGVHLPAPSAAAARDSRKRAARREAFALRTLATHAGMGKTRVEFRSGRLAAEFALTQVTSSWRREEEAARTNSITTNNNSQNARNNDQAPSMQQAQRQPSVDKIEQCLRALSMMPHHLAVVVPTLRKAIYSDAYAGIVVPETQTSAAAAAAAAAVEDAALKGLPYYAVCDGLETSNERLLSDMDALKQALADMRKDRDAHAAMLKDSNGKIKELREKFIESEANNKIVKKQLANMREIASDTLEDNEGVTKRFVELDQQHGQLRMEHKTAKKQLADLRERYSAVSDELGHAIRNCGRWVVFCFMGVLFVLSLFWFFF